MRRSLFTIRYWLLTPQGNLYRLQQLCLREVFIKRAELSKLLWLISCLFFISGATGLVYQVLWSRILSLIFGTTHLAVTTVLAAFMGGLALGSFVFGRWADRMKNLVRVYGVLEIGIGVYALITPWLFASVARLHETLYREIGGDQLFFIIVRVGVSLLILGIPTTLMGGTLPVLSRVFIKRLTDVTAKLGFLYSLNTIGAFVGTMLAGFVLIRHFGMLRTLVGTGLVNIALGVIVIVFERRLPTQELAAPKPRPIKSPVAAQGAGSRGGVVFAGIAYFTAGFCALATEVGWTRGLTLVLGSSVYAFTIMLATMLAGIGLGSWIVTWFQPRVRYPLQAFAFVEIVLGFSVLVSTVLLGQLPVLFVDVFFKIPATFFALEAMKFGLTVVVMIVPTLLMGAAFPLIGQYYIRRQEQLGRQVGNLYSINTLGGIVGSALGGFLFIPTIGTRGTLLVMGSLFLVIGLSAFSLCRELARKQRATLVAIMIVLSSVLLYKIPPWDKLLMTSAVYVYAPEIKDGFEGDRKFLFFEEGIHSLVSVNEKAGIKSLRINGKTDGSNGEDMVTQVLLAQAPLLFHPNPETCLIIGLGTGVTAGSALTHSLARVDCVEIDESVVRAAREFKTENYNALENPRLNLILGDARTVLACSDHKYDVIIAEPSNPWITGVSNLFTSEQFGLYRDNLNPGGIVCQWVHSYYMNLDDLKLIFRTLLNVFEHVTLWESSKGDYLLTATIAPYDYESKLDDPLPSPLVAQDLNRIGVHSYRDLINRRLLEQPELKAFVGSGPVNTDDKPIIEFSAPQSIFQPTERLNRAAIDAARSSR